MSHDFDARATVRFVRDADADADAEAVTTIRQVGPAAPPAAPPPPRPIVVVADRDAATAGWVARRLADLADVRAVSSAAGAVALLRAQANPVAIVGHALDDAPAERLIAALVARTPAAVIAVGGGAAAPASHPGLYYQIDRGLDPATVRQVVGSALARRPRPAPELADPVALQRLAGAARKVALQRTSGDVARAIVDVVPALVDADRAACLFFDATTGTLWAAPAPGAPALEHPAAGLAGFAARTGTPVYVDRVGDDPRFRAAIDGPRCAADDRLAVVPLVDADGEVHALIQVVRSARGAVLGPVERALLTGFAARVTPILDALALEARAEALAPAAAPGAFRAEALAAHGAPAEEGRALRIAPRWTRASYWLLLAFMISALTYLCLARVDDVAEGKAVFLAEGHHAVAFASAGTVGQITVTPGTRVAAGDPLVAMHDAGQRADLAAIERELEQRLVDRLEHPDDETTAAPLAALLARRHRAELAVGERVLRAPVAGVIADVRVRPGQSIAAGDEALTLVADGHAGEASVIALLPASQAPLVRPGMALRLAVDGHRAAFVAVIVDSVTRDATGPAVARQLLGAGLADSVAIAGPVMLVRGHPRSSDFVVDGRRLALRHGMTGRASITLRSQPMITALIPGLTEVLGHD